MIFTHVDHELCVVYPPHFVGPERLGRAASAQGAVANARDAERVRGPSGGEPPLEPILLWRGTARYQEREQWSSAVILRERPGGRHVIWAHEARSGIGEDGISIVGDRLSRGDAPVREGERAAITFEGATRTRVAWPALHDTPISRDDRGADGMTRRIISQRWRRRASAGENVPRLRGRGIFSPAVQRTSCR